MLQHINVSDAMKDYFVINAHGRNTRNFQHLIKIPQVKTEFGGNGFYYLAGKEFNNLPRNARKIECYYKNDSVRVKL